MSFAAQLAAQPGACLIRLGRPRPCSRLRCSTPPAFEVETTNADGSKRHQWLCVEHRAEYLELAPTVETITGVTCQPIL